MSRKSASMVTQQHCPSGHTIPHKTNRGECHVMHCADPEDRPKRGATKKKDRPGPKIAFAMKREKAIEIATKKLVEQVKRTPLELPAGASAGLATEGKLESLAGTSIAYGKHHARLAFVKGLPASDADEVTINNWADKRAVQLLPLAIAEKEYQLKFGDDDQRDRAADSVLRMTGRNQKEGQLSGGAAIILNLSGFTLPYAPKRDGEVVDAVVADGGALAKKQA